MSFRPFALSAASSAPQVMIPTSSSPVSSNGGSPAPPTCPAPLGSSGGPPVPHKSCREAGRPMLTDPSTGHFVCSCEYPGPGLLGAYPRLHPSLLGLAGDPYSSAAAAYAAGASPAPGYLALPGDPASTAALYSQMGAPFEIKESPDGLRTLTQTSPFYYDPGLAYPYSYNGLELSSAARRKNATRENTNTLKAWLYEHRKNPYPTKGEKIMLAIITKMTLTQVSTWFANARRRLKKENKMTWSPRSGGRDDDDDDDDDVTHDGGDVTTPDKTQEPRDLCKDLGSTGEEEDKEEEEEDIIIDEGFEEQNCLASSRLQASLAAEALRRTSMPPSATNNSGALPPSASPERNSPSPQSPRDNRSVSPHSVKSDNSDSPSFKLNTPGHFAHSNNLINIDRARLNSSFSSRHEDSDSEGENVKSHSDPPTVVIASKCSTTEANPKGPKPRIWSLADVATSNSPPPGRKSPQMTLRPPLRSPWAVTATYALAQQTPHPPMPHPGYLMMARTPLAHPLFVGPHQPPKISPNGPMEDLHATARLGGDPHHMRMPPHGDSPNKSPMDNSAPHRTPNETAFKPVHKRISTS